MNKNNIYTFLRENSIEINIEDDSKIWMFLAKYQLDEFYTTLGKDPWLYDDSCLEGFICKGYVAVNLVEICNYYDIECNTGELKEFMK